VQEQVEQIEGRNHTYAVGKRGAHCAIGLATYHAQDLATDVILVARPQPPRPGIASRTPWSCRTEPTRTLSLQTGCASRSASKPKRRVKPQTFDFVGVEVAGSAIPDSIGSAE
jgi:hypothetical protein